MGKGEVLKGEGKAKVACLPYTRLYPLNIFAICIYYLF